MQLVPTHTLSSLKSLVDRLSSTNEVNNCTFSHATIGLDTNANNGWFFRLISDLSDDYFDHCRAYIEADCESRNFLHTLIIPYPAS